MPSSGGLGEDERTKAQMAAMKKMMAQQGMMPGMEQIFSQMHGLDAAAVEQPTYAAQDTYQSAHREVYGAHPPVSEGPQMWEVVGGGDKGGIIVRIDRDLASPQEKKRLSTGALIREEELVGDRLRYTRVSGAGPVSGWVSCTVSGTGKALVRRVELEPEPVEEAPPPVHRPAVVGKGRTAASTSAQSSAPVATFDPPPREKAPAKQEVSAPKVHKEVIHVPDMEDVLKAIDQDAEEEVEVPDIDEVLAAIERDAREEEELNAASATREEFFNLSAPSTVVVKTKQWWEEEPKLRLDGPKFNFQTVGLLGRHAYADSTGTPVQPPERNPPAGDWFRSSSGLSERLAKGAAGGGAAGSDGGAKAPSIPE